MYRGLPPAGQPLEIEGASQSGLVTKNGLILYGTDGKAVSASQVFNVLSKPIFRASKNKSGRASQGLCCLVIRKQQGCNSNTVELCGPFPSFLLLYFIHSAFCPQLLVKNLQFEDGKMIPASKYFSSGESTSIELTDEEKKMAEEIRASKLLK